MLDTRAIAGVEVHGDDFGALSENHWLSAVDDMPDCQDMSMSAISEPGSAQHDTVLPASAGVLEGLEDASSFWPFATSWQWTHEDLYLQADAPVQPTATPGPAAFEYNQAQVLPAIGHEESGEYHIPPLSDVVEEMIKFASSMDAWLQPDLSIRWHTFSEQLSQHITIVYPTEEIEEPKSLLKALVKQYFSHFHPLWSLLPNNNASAADFHPLLYLTLTSIGALYSGSNTATTYGSLVHDRVRTTLIHYAHRHGRSEAEALDLGRAMLLAQVTALYYEQHGGFSAAQRLAATLYEHAHRMRLFTLKRSNRHSGQAPENTICGVDASFVEGRKMLAFGMLRVETFMSILFNRKPLISSEEIDLPLPQRYEPSEAAAQPESDMFQGHVPCGGLLFSDLVRVTLDDGELIPGLRPFDAEILLFGLQHEVWRFSHDPDIFMRLTGVHVPASSCSTTTATQAELVQIDHLDRTSRKMRSLVSEHKRIVTALLRWKQAMTLSQLSDGRRNYRSTYLSSLILHDLSLLRLSAPLDAIQQTAYRLHEPPTPDPGLVADIFDWASTDQAVYAIKHAQSIWHMLSRETSRPQSQQAKYNILALIALHHAAVVVWAVAGTNAQTETRFVGADEDETRGLPLRREQTYALMIRFAELYPPITSTWGMQSSFSKMVTKLASNLFPSMDTEPNRSLQDRDLLML